MAKARADGGRAILVTPFAVSAQYWSKLLCASVVTNADGFLRMRRQQAAPPDSDARGPGPVAGRPVTSSLARAFSDTCAAHPAQADSDLLQVSSLPGSGRLGSPAEHTAQADQDPASMPRHTTPATAASPGRALAFRVLARHTLTGPIV